MTLKPDHLLFIFLYFTYSSSLPPTTLWSFHLRSARLSPDDVTAVWDRKCVMSSSSRTDGVMWCRGLLQQPLRLMSTSKQVSSTSLCACECVCSTEGLLIPKLKTSSAAPYVVCKICWCWKKKSYGHSSYTNLVGLRCRWVKEASRGRISIGPLSHRCLWGKVLLVSDGLWLSAWWETLCALFY